MNDTPEWIDKIKARGLAGPCRTLLDVLEPFGPLSAQMLYVLQPVGSVFGWGRTIRHLADALEQPDGVETLRHHLADDD